MDVTVLLGLIQQFVSNEDHSIALVNDIEVELDDAFPDDEFMQDTVLMLASYRPGGGEFLYDEVIVKEKLNQVRDKLLKHSKTLNAPGDHFLLVPKP